MADLPSELFPEILSRLPVQSLLRFRSISKSLKSLIDSHNFTNLHLKNSLNLNLILWRRPEFYQIDLPNLTTTISLNHHIGYKHDVLLGSCNGLLCISNILNEIALWNPNINKHQTIPYLPFPESRYFSRLPGGNIIFHGFGFDPFAGDYKLIRISCPYKLIRRSCPVTMNQQPGTFESQVRLFSSKRNSWKVLPNMPYALYNDDDMNVAVENSLHLVVSRKPAPIQQCLIVAFNLTHEIFNEVPLPEIHCDKFEINVSLLGECLCMTVSYQTKKVNTADIWVMKEYGLRDSWCKLFTLRPSLRKLGFYTPSKPWMPSLRLLCYSSDRSKILLEVDCSNLFWYDLNSKKFSGVPGIPISVVPGFPCFDKAMFCVPSLLSPSLIIGRRTGTS